MKLTKETPFYQNHLQFNAKMVDFADFKLPISYTRVSEEHKQVRNGVGVFDVSHMGEFILKGKNALSLIQKLCTNDASKLKVGGAQYTCMTNETGGIIDDLIIYHLNEHEYLLVVNAANIQKDWDWIKKHIDDDIELTDVSESWAQMAIQGPKATEAIQSLTKMPLDEIKFYTFQKGNFAGVDDVIVSATGYTGSGGFELYFDRKHADQVWTSVFKAGESVGIVPVGLAARDTLRLEMGYCLYGNDIDMTTSPIEAGLSWITKFTKDFTACDILKQQKSDGVEKKLVAFEMTDKGIPRTGYGIIDQTEKKIGRVTSGTMSPSLEKGIGMGYVPAEYAKIGTTIYIKIRKKTSIARIVKLPFYKG